MVEACEARLQCLLQDAVGHMGKIEGEGTGYSPPVLTVVCRVRVSALKTRSNMA